MGKKKFIDKKKAATFQLLARDTSDPVYYEGPEKGRVFVRVDNNPVSINGLDDNGSEFGNDPNSIFADAPDDVAYDGFGSQNRDPLQLVDGLGPLPDHIRREILVLGFPDDGYNYLIHLREIRNTGGGSAYYHNTKANLHDLPHDVKAYDASRVHLNEAIEDTSPKTLYNVAERTVNVQVQKAVDPDIAKLLDDNESDFGSDVEDLEEDFVVLANLPEEGADGDSEKNLTSVSKPQEEVLNEFHSASSYGLHTKVASASTAEVDLSANEEPRVNCLLDQQFDLLERQEYGTESDDDYDDLVADEDISLSEKLNNALKGQETDDLECDEYYKAPSDILHDKERAKDGEIVSTAADILRRCAEYAKKYENADEDDREVVIVEESSDDSEVWDCETIVSTCSNLDNHPGRIGAPEITRKNKLAETISGALKKGTDNKISFGGKEKIPVDYLPNGRKTSKEKAKAATKTEQPKRKPHGQESKEEKKERKAAVKEERREARRLKKEMKGLYRDEAKRAQKVAAVSRPSSIHLM
ncbi:hypothetical protein Cgig2_026538 [Carnegiea gigantea]|uniref:Protein LTV1 homolog n=1 Tax=Carnegiea gigantea TaxID=171969 RepID=A0A9Q1KGU9_9CARY|nr:hypothetical protein Cgig2_026538 [Carnegiea gigantea]